jgi:hypothetical protein
MMDAKPLAEDAAQRVMRGFMADVDALGLPEEHRRAVARLIMPMPKRYTQKDIQLARGRIVPTDISELLTAAHWGHLATIREGWNTFFAVKLQLVEMGMGPMVCSQAASGGHLEVVQWLHSRGCGWDSCTSTNAARGGHLPLLQWAHAHGCPLDEGCCTAAAVGGQFEMLRWLRAEGCPWHAADVALAAQRHGHTSIYEWVMSQQDS